MYYRTVHQRRVRRICLKFGSFGKMSIFEGSNLTLVIKIGDRSQLELSFNLTYFLSVSRDTVNRTFTLFRRLES